MSSLVQRQRQQEQPPQKPHIPSKKALTRRSVSFEKFLVTAFHIRLACTKCSRESLRFCLEMLILRSRIITEHWMAAVKLLVQLSHEWNNTFLEIANVIIPKWQFRAREIVETTILQRQWRREQEKRIIKSDTKATQTTESHKQDVVAVADGDEEEPGNMLKVRETAVPKVAVEKANEFDKENPIPTDEDRTMRQRLAIAVTICMIFLALQLCLGVVLILMSAQGLLLGQLFLVACVAYIAYLLQSICDFTRTKTTSCKTPS